MPTFLGRRRALLGGGRRAASANVSQFFDRLPTIPVIAVQNLYSTLINSLTADGAFAALDALCIFAVDDPGNSLVNLVSSSFKPQLVTVAGSPTWTQYRGWTCVGVNNCVSSNFIPSAGVKYVQDAATFGVWSLTNSKIAFALWRSDLSTTVECYPFYTDNRTYTRANNATEDSTLNAVSDSLGLFLTNRVSSAGYAVYKNDVQVANYPARPSTTPESNVIKIGFGAYQIAGYAVGALSNSQKTTLYNAMLAFYSNPAIGAV